LKEKSKCDERRNDILGKDSQINNKVNSDVPNSKNEEVVSNEKKMVKIDVVAHHEGRPKIVGLDSLNAIVNNMNFT
jgi:hypothetical protein